MVVTVHTGIALLVRTMPATLLLDRPDFRALLSASGASNQNLYWEGNNERKQKAAET